MNKFFSIMAFYIFLSYILAPLLFYILFGRTFKSAGNGFAFGSIASIILWYTYGSKMV